MKIIKSLSVIAIVTAIAVGATTAYFSDEEKAVGNTFTAGTIDISVDNQNPWHTSWQNKLDKPSQTNYMNFTIKNVGENPANIWKKIHVADENGGSAGYSCVYSPNMTPVMVSSEPECQEGTGDYTHPYIERADLSSYMVYDMSICKKINNNACELEGDSGNQHPKANTGWVVIVDENDEVRVDNVNDIWIKLNSELLPAEELLVSQSYHLKAWTDAAEPEITNWAQGDVMTFDVVLEARQTDAPAPNGAQMATLQLKEKDPVTWNVVQDGASGTLTFKIASNTFDYSLIAAGLNNSISYSLIYYADPWPGNHPGKLIGVHTTDSSGNINDLNKTVDLAMDLPQSTDANYPVGAKIQLVLTDDYDSANSKLTAWHPSEYLFEMNLVSYDDTNH